jgi:TonB family protein
MTPLAQAISGALLQFVWQGLLVGLLVTVAGFLLRTRQPNTRYLLYCVALCAFAALPVITAIALYDPLPGNAPAHHPAVTLTIRAVWNGAATPAASFAKWLDASQPWVFRIWIIGVTFLSLRLAWLAARVASLRRSGEPAGMPIMAVAGALAHRMGTSRAVRVIVSEIPDGPSVIGWFRPVVLLPVATILNLTPDQLEAILAHEIAHLRRYDDIVNIAQSIIETLLFYHPAVWWVSNRIRHERELCCDDLAVRASGGAICYARALTALEALRVTVPGLALGALGTAASPLEYRIRRIIGASSARSGHLPSALPGVLALALTVASIVIYSGPAKASAPVPPLQMLPAYPESARLDGIQGTVPVEVKIDRLGRVRGAKAIGGPRELRQAAVESASVLQFAPAVVKGMEQVDVAFQLAVPAPAPLVPAQDSQPVRTGPHWRDNGESAIGLAANTEKDPAKQLDILEQWEQLYPNSEFRAQRALMTAQALLGVLSTVYGNTDPAILDAGKKAAQQLAEHFNEYLDDSVKPDTLTSEEWAFIRKTSELQIHTILAYIAQTNHDNVTAEVELNKVLALDPDRAEASYQLATTIQREITTSRDGSRYPEAFGRRGAEIR